MSTCTVRLQAPKMIEVTPVTKQSANLNFNIFYGLKTPPQSSKKPHSINSRVRSPNTDTVERITFKRQ